MGVIVPFTGTLGVVTKVALMCPARPAAMNLALLGMNSFDDVLKIFKKVGFKL